MISAQYRAGREGWVLPKSKVVKKSYVVHTPANWIDFPVHGDTVEEAMRNVL